MYLSEDFVLELGNAFACIMSAGGEAARVPINSMILLTGVAHAVMADYDD